MQHPQLRVDETCEALKHSRLHEEAASQTGKKMKRVRRQTTPEEKGRDTSGDLKVNRAEGGG